MIGISEADFDELSSKLEEAMVTSARKTTHATHADEDGFFTKFMGRLGKINFGTGYFLDFQDSKTTSKGAGSAEKEYGCDFGLRVDFFDNGHPNFSKAIIGQAKNYPRNSPDHGKSEHKRLADQCSAMANVTKHYIVTFRPKTDGNIPFVYLGDVETQSYKLPGIRFDTYLLNFVLPCYHGETDKRLIKYMVSATHAGWKEHINIFSIKTNLPKPSPSPKVAPGKPLKKL